MSRILARTQTCSLPQVEARLAELGAERLPSSRWRCTCNYLRSEELFVLHTMEAPSEHFIVTKAAGGGERVLRAGAEFEPLIEKAQACAQRLNVLIEGSVYACGDFVVRVGQLFLNKGTLTGVAVEVEYLPCTLATAAVAPLAAFIDLLLPSGERDFCSSEVECFASNDLPCEFTLEHSALLVVGLMRARLGVPAR